MRPFEHNHLRHEPSSSSRKRRRLRPTIEYQTTPAKQNDSNQNLEDSELWADQSFFPTVDPFSEDSEALIDQDILRDFFAPDAARESWEADIASLSSQASDLDQCDAVTNVLFPDLPSVDHREIDLSLLNPFSEGSISRYSAPRAVVAAEGEVNGYIKFRLQRTQNGFNEVREAKDVFGRNVFGKRPSSSTMTVWDRKVVPLLPPGFGRALKLDVNDQKLLTFYITAYCRGRTLIPQNNVWLTEITPMAESEPCVQHSLLALSGAYVLDYVQSDDLIKRTNRHYAKACELISKALMTPEAHDVGKSAALTAAVLLMEADDEIIWELRRPKTQIPNFIRGIHLAKRLLDHSDPGYRYWKANNVQCTKSWTGLSAVIAIGCILPELMSPLLPVNPKDSNYSWLLWGTKEEVHTIYGAKGLSPKLIHIFAQITRLCTQLRETPHSMVIPMGAIKVQEILESFRQRSRLSEGYSTATALLDSCELDEHGKVSSATKVTELSGECWVWAAKIYLHCRFFRKPPSHPDVRSSLDVLSRCVKRLPQAGPLLTAQTPFFPVFLMAIVSYTQEDRTIAREWFESTLSRGGRSNIPPVWDAVQLLWSWLDASQIGAETTAYDDEIPVGLRNAWWEDMVEYLMEEVGWMSLT